MSLPIDTPVSIVMPVYNGAKYLPQAIESVLDQTYKNFEFIIIDDGSSDNSPDIIEEYAQKDERIRFYRQKNSGVPVTLNNGIRLAQSEIIVRMDADDIMLPQRLEKQIPFLLSHPEATVVSCFAYHINSKGERIGKSGTYPYIQSVEHSIRHMKKGGMIFCLHPGVMFWKNPILNVGGYDEKLPVSEDTDLWNRLADKQLYTIVMPERLMDYRIHMSAASSAWHKINYRNWIYLNIQNRRKGKPEVAYDDFLIRNQNAYLRRLNYIRKAYGAFVERASEVMYGEGKYFPFAFYCVGCFFLRPRLTMIRIMNHFRESSS